MKKLLSLAFLMMLGSVQSFSQGTTEVIQAFLNAHSASQGLTPEDIAQWNISSQHKSSTSGVQHVYIQQEYQGVPVYNAIANFALKDQKVISMGNRLVDHLGQKVNATSPSITPFQAIEAAAQSLGLDQANELRVKEAVSAHHFIYHKNSLSQEDIPVKLMYQVVSETEVRLAWDLSIYLRNSQHWWSVRIDALNGSLLDQHDWVVHCNFEHSPFTKCNNAAHGLLLPSNLTAAAPESAPQTMMQPDQYTVFALPLESPNHGNRSVVVNPADSLASPYGWHDINGTTGAEYTITRGNNVYAYEDVANSNAPGFSPDGTASLDFNFPYTASSGSTSYQAAAITNLFYMNNMMHDIWYHYGFDEASGNFQDNNYGRGGADDDYVFAEAQDGGGTNNANFATPGDGDNPRMQMYLWNSGGSTTVNYLTINAPATIAGGYNATGAAFGPGIPTIPVTADVVLVTDGTAPANDGCEPLTNGAQVSGKIALIDRGNCNFATKVEEAQAAGAVAAIVVNNVAGAPIQMGGNSTIVTIPSIMITLADGNAIKAQLANGAVNATISDPGGGGANLLDGDFDNGIIAHEYGHGISTRLTGGANSPGCLSNAEQMGEGWSDWFGLMLTIEPGDQRTDVRGIGTFAAGQPVTGNGIRPAPYSTDFAVNGFTYGASNNAGQISQPHGVGFIFATVLWDLTWDLIDQYGGTPDPDLYNGTGGNNIAMNLVMEGLKLQPCNPGMIDGRDAILQADQLLYNGIHRCLIWETFAKRGFGFSASQGSSASRSDQVEAFDLPPICQTPTLAPAAAFAPSSSNACVTTISFTDNSTDIPQSWLWDFGDGNTSTIQNPTHTYSNSGTFTVKLVVTNSIGSDSTTQQVTIALPPSPTAADVQVCAGGTALVVAQATGTAQWRNIANNVIYNGDTLTVNNVASTQTFYVENLVGSASQNVGPANNNIGGGGYHSTGYHGAVNFTASQSLEIVSVWLDADGAGPRTIYLASGANTDGSAPGANDIVDQVTVNLVDGVQRVNLNFIVPASGTYNLGANSAALYRNSSGAAYPYTLTNYLTMDNSSASGANANTYYYYFYDWEVRDLQCVSAPDTVTVAPVVSSYSFANNNLTVTFTDNSVDATSWFWDFGDGNTSTQQNPVHTYAAAGTYNVTLTINNGACSSTQTIPLVTSVTNVNTNVPKISVLPNPSTGWIQVLLDKAVNEQLAVQVIDLNGRILQSQTLESGIQALDLDLSDYPAAVYMIQIQGENFKELRKLVKE